jgi:hypothetical protein
MAAFRVNWNHSKSLHSVAIFIECFFLFNFIIKFFREFKKPNADKPTKNLKECAIHYLKTDCIIDFIALIPFPYILKLEGDAEDLFFLLKQIRMYDLFKTFDRLKLAKYMGNWIFFSFISHGQEKMIEFKFQYNILEHRRYKTNSEKKAKKQDLISQNDSVLLAGYMIDLLSVVYAIFQATFQMSMMFIIYVVAIEQWYDEVNYSTPAVYAIY